MLLATIPLIALWGIAAPAIQSLMSRNVDHSAQGKLQGAINSLRAITGMAGPILFTQVFASAISPRSSPHLPGAPYLLAALLLFSSLLLADFVTRSSVAASPKVSMGESPERSEEHTSELQSPCNLVCRLLLEKKNETQP